MIKTLLLLLCSFLDAGTQEKLVVVDYVDMVEVNHKYFQDSDSKETKKQRKKRKESNAAFESQENLRIQILETMDAHCVGKTKTLKHRGAFKKDATG